MAIPNFYSAVYAIIKNKKGEVLFGRRKNSGFKDGFLQFPAGHIEGKETMKEACMREVKEEVNLDVLENDLEIVHISHRICSDRVYYDVYMEVKKYNGNLQINEPEKCSELLFVDISKLPEDNFVMYDIEQYVKSKNGENFSDIVLN